MPISPRGSLRATSLLGAAILALGVGLPVSATAMPVQAGGTVAHAAGHSEEQATRAEERAARAQERRAARARERSAREAERRAAREQRRGAREQERATREAERSAREAERAARRAARREAQSQPQEPGSGEDSGQVAAPAAGSSRACQLSIEASSNRITAGETVSISGKLSCPVTTTLASAAGRAVDVYERQLGDRGPNGGAGASSVLATATTEADGSYHFTAGALETNTIFRVRAGNRGAHTVVKVAPQVTLSAPAPGAVLSAVGSAVGAHSRAPARTRSTFTGTVSPADTGAAVALQIAYPGSGGHWRLLAFGRVGSDGTYSITHAFRTPGEVSVRAVVHEGKQNVPGISAPLAYEAPQPENSQLTIETSADPIAYGSTVTISGTASAGANEPVTLLARTAGGAFAAVAHTNTDEGGNYTFTQAPLQGTYYRVTDATAKSAVLLEAVSYALTSEPAPSTASTGQQLTFSGTLTPAHSGQLVYLERENPSGIGFHLIGSASVQAGTPSTYSIAYDFAAAGTYVMRIEVSGEGAIDASTSEPFTVVVSEASTTA